MAEDVLGGPIQIRYDGLDADRHEIEMAALAESLRGLNRIISVCSNLVATGRLIQHKDALSVRVIARAPEAHYFEMWAWVQWAGQHPFFSATGATLAAGLITYVFQWAAGQREEMRHLRGALDVAIKELGTRDQAVVDRLLGTIDRMAEALKPAAKQAVAPIGDSVSTLTVNDASRTHVARIGLPEKKAIMEEEGIQIDDEKEYHVILSELNVESGSCKVRLWDEPEKRYSGRITDPTILMPNNKYVLAMAARESLTVRAKAALKQGEIDELFISDCL